MAAQATTTNGFKVTEVRIRPGGTGSIRARASITICNSFVVNDLRIMEGANGLWVAMPSRKGSDDQYHDIAFPITAEARAQIQEAVISAYYGGQGEG